MCHCYPHLSKGDFLPEEPSTYIGIHMLGQWSVSQCINNRHTGSTILKEYKGDCTWTYIGAFGGYQSLWLSLSHLPYLTCCFKVCIEHCSIWPIPFLSIHVLWLDSWLHADSLSFILILNPFPIYTGLSHICSSVQLLHICLYPLFKVIHWPLSIIKQVFVKEVSKP